MEQQTPNSFKSRMKPRKIQNAPFSNPWLGGRRYKFSIYFVQDCKWWLISGGACNRRYFFLVTGRWTDYRSPSLLPIIIFGINIIRHNEYNFHIFPEKSTACIIWAFGWFCSTKLSFINHAYAINFFWTKNEKSKDYCKADITTCIAF